MEVIRLSDKVPGLLELCASCRLSIQIPSLQTKDIADVSCQLCALIESLRSKKSNALLPTVLGRLLPPPSTRKQVKRALGGETIDNLNNIIFYDGQLDGTEANFEHPYIPPGKVSKSPPQPIVRLVPRKIIDISLVQKWIAGCEKAHSKCHPLQDIIFEPKDQLEVILVDVKNKKLVESTSSCRYMALSYVWGKVPQLLLEESNLLELQKHMALDKRWDEIPRLLQDAIHFVNEIGEQYLWIDTLCIVQDSDTRHNQIARMDEIYKGASCTLIALDCKDASDGLPGVQPNTRSAPQIAQLRGLNVSRRRPELAGIFAESTYERRGWTFQERLLSNRCLYFTNEQLYFHCQTVLWSEDKYEYFQQDAELFGHHPSLTWRSDSRYETRLEKHDACAHWVGQYTQRHLSFQSDRLTAFSGIAHSLTKEWGWEFLHGLPLQALHLSLMWDFSEIPQKRTYESQTKTAVAIPSWSWAGWTGGVHYQLVQTHIPGFTRLTTPQLDDIEVLLCDQDYRLHITKSGEVAMIFPDQSQDCAAKIPIQSPSRDLLSFKAEQTSTKGFVFYQTTIVKGFNIPNRSSNDIIRITDSKFRACGVLFHTRTGPSLFSKNKSNENDKGNLQFVLMGTTRRPLTCILEENVFKHSLDDGGDEEDYKPNIYHEHYERSVAGWRTCNVMLVEWGENREFAERIAVGQIHEIAWNETNASVGQVLLG